MIVGNDLSEFQGEINWETYKNNSNFTIIKLSEGTSYIDKWGGNNRQKARETGLPHGFYHLARYDLGNNPQDEAKFFENLIDGDPIREGEILALDLEYGYKDLVNWAKEWLDEISSHFHGIKPYVYLNQSLAQSYNWSPIINSGYQLWGAGYTYNPGNTDGLDFGAWGIPNLIQWEDNESVPGINGNVDADEFSGTVDELKAYGYKAPVISTPEQPVLQNQTPADSPQTQANPQPTEPIPATVTKTNFPTVIKWLKWIIKELETM